MIRIPKKRVAVTPIFDPTFAGAEHAVAPGAVKVKIGDNEYSSGGAVDLWIPDDARERCDQGIVKYLGADVTEVKIGDYVIFSGYVGTLVNIDGERLIILPEDFVQATLHEPPVTDVPGLYFRGTDGEYFTATYEQAFELISRAFRDAPWHKQFKVTSYAPKPEDYNKLKAGSG